MNLKKMWVLSVLLVALTVLSLTGCKESVKAKELIVSNSSSSTVTITGVQINQYVGAKIMQFENIMPEGETIAPGESESFYMAPTTSPLGTELSIEYGEAPSYDYYGFTYDYEVDGENKAVTVTFDGTDFTVSGSNAQELPPV